MGINLRNKNFYSVTLPFILWNVAIFFASSIPGKDLPEISLWNWDKLVHCFVYAVLMILGARFFYLRKTTLKGVIIKSTLYSFGFALSDELHQYFVPNRMCSWEDIVADVVGIMGVALWIDKSGVFRKV